MPLPPRPVGVSFLQRPGGVQLAYVKTAAPPQSQSPPPPATPALLFCPGLLSDMQGNKALALEALAGRLKCPYLRFDYSGHGQSRGAAFVDCDPRDWRGDALAAFDELLHLDNGTSSDLAAEPAASSSSSSSSSQPRRVIVVGSSMGGLIALHLALARPAAVAALVLVAPALGLGERAWARLSAAARAAIQAGGTAPLGSPFAPPGADLARLRFFDGARALDAGLAAHGGSGGGSGSVGDIPVACPVHILHGALDDVVPLSVSEALVARLASRDVALTTVKGGDHRLSSARDLALLESVVELLHARVAAAVAAVDAAATDAAVPPVSRG